jgi:hypothetical protein
MVESLPEDDVAMLLDAFFELLLQETTAMLIFAHSGYLANKILEPTASIAVIWVIKVSQKAKGKSVIGEYSHIHDRFLLVCVLHRRGNHSSCPRDRGPDPQP